MKVVHHIDGNPWNNHPSNLRVMDAAQTPKPMHGIWTLTAPDGRQWTALTPLACAAAESRERIPATVALARIHAAADEPTELEKELLSALIELVQEFDHDRGAHIQEGGGDLTESTEITRARAAILKATQGAT